MPYFSIATSVLTYQPAIPPSLPLAHHGFACMSQAISITLIEISFVAVEVCCVVVNVVIVDDSLEKLLIDVDCDVNVVEKSSVDDILVVRG